MKLLFNLEAVEGKRIHTRPGEHLNLLARAETEIGIATAQEFLEKITPVIFTGNRRETIYD